VIRRLPNDRLKPSAGSGLRSGLASALARRGLMRGVGPNEDEVWVILRMAGVNHFDPAGPGALATWFENQLDEATEPPLFVATEWSRWILPCVKGQRPGFRQLLLKEWPHAPRHLLDVLEQTLAYEGDTHQSALPEARVLWLGRTQGRDNPVIREYAERRAERVS